MTLLQTLIATIQALGVLAGVGVAFKGLNTWRRQKVEGRRIDIAEEALRGFARMKDILFDVSNGMVWAHELEDIQNNFLENFQEDHRKRVAALAAPLHRLSRHREEIDAFFDQRYVCVAYFGEGAEKLFERMRKILVEVRVASQMLVARETPSLADEHTQEFYEKLKRVIWMGSIEDHDLHKETASAAEDAIAFFGKELRSR